MLLLLLAVLPASNAYAGADAHFKEFAQGAQARYSSCPWEGPAPPVGTVCDDYIVWYVRFDATGDGGPTNRAKQPFVALLEHLTFVIDGPDSARDLAFEFGSTENVTGTYDKTALSIAHMDGATFPMYSVDLETGEVAPNGRTTTFGPTTWTPFTETTVWGIDGPALGDVPLHLVDRCTTENNKAHQKVRWATVSDPRVTIDGVPIDAPFVPELPGGIFNNWFHSVHVSHGGLAC